MSKAGMVPGSTDLGIFRVERLVRVEDGDVCTRVDMLSTSPWCSKNTENGDSKITNKTTPEINEGHSATV